MGFRSFATVNCCYSLLDRTLLHSLDLEVVDCVISVFWSRVDPFSIFGIDSCVFFVVGVDLDPHPYKASRREVKRAP